MPYAIGVTVALVHAILPVDRISEWLFKVPGEEADPNIGYDKCKEDNDSDYALENPAYKYLARQAEVAEIIKKKWFYQFIIFIKYFLWIWID